LGYDFEILYKPGKENIVVDGLSLIVTAETPLYTTISMCQPTILSQLQTFYESHTVGQLLVQKLIDKNTTQTQFSLHQGVLYFKGKLFIP